MNGPEKRNRSVMISSFSGSCFYWQLPAVSPQFFSSIRGRPWACVSYVHMVISASSGLSCFRQGPIGSDPPAEHLLPQSGPHSSLMLHYRELRFVSNNYCRLPCNVTGLMRQLFIIITFLLACHLQPPTSAFHNNKTQI